MSDNLLTKYPYFWGIMSRLSEILKDLMQEAEIYAPALAKPTGIDASTFMTLRRGDVLTYVDKLVQIADHFHISTGHM